MHDCVLAAGRLYQREGNNMANRSHFRHTILIGWFPNKVTDGEQLCACCRQTVSEGRQQSGLS